MKYQSRGKWFRGIMPAGMTCGCLLTVAIYLAACSTTTGMSGNSGTASGMSSVNLHISDPATCEAPAGPFSHVYVTITDVQVNTSSSADTSDSGWVDLTPNLSSAPRQIDLLGQANNQCFLADLGDALQLQPGSYQQIRLILAPDGTSIANNACGNDANCVVLASDNSVHDLLLSSEAKTGIKIPSGQIAGGNFTITAGQTMDLDIDFSTCESIVQEGNGKYRLKPVLHAGEVSTTSTSINGKVLDSATGNAVSGMVLIALEQKDSTGVDRIQRSTLAGSDGSFVFCPLPSGMYDVVIVGARSDGALYQPTVVTGVSVGSTVSTVDLHPPAAAAGSAMTLAGTVTSQNASNMGTVADVQVSVLETISGTTYTIPLPPVSGQSSATLSLETASSTSCTTGTDCAMYSMQLPAGGPYIGAWSSGGITLSLSSSTVSYVVDGMAFVPSSGGTAADCNPSELKSAAYGTGSTGPVQTLAFMQCQ
jgi:Domain of unknown function (DUF4382)